MYEENFCIKRIRELMDKNGFTSYQLAKKSDVSLSTLLSMFDKNTEPRVETIAKLCSACNISIAQFFERSSRDLTEEQTEFLSLFDSLSPEDRHTAHAFLRFLSENK